MFSPQYQEIAATPREQQLAFLTYYHQQPQYPTITDQDTKERVRPLWKFFAVLPPNLLLVGYAQTRKKKKIIADYYQRYLILPVAFKDPGPESEPDPHSNMHVNKAAITIAASILIAVAYVSSLVLALAQSHNGSFTIQSVYMCVASRLYC